MFRPAPPSLVFGTSASHNHTPPRNTPDVNAMFSPRTSIPSLTSHAADDDQQGCSIMVNVRSTGMMSAEPSPVPPSCTGAVSPAKQHRKSFPVVTIVDEAPLEQHHAASSSISFTSKIGVMPLSPPRGNKTRHQADIGLPGCRMTWDSPPLPPPHSNNSFLVGGSQQAQRDAVSPNRTSPPSAASSSALAVTLPALPGAAGNDVNTPPASFCAFLPRALQPKDHIRFLSSSTTTPEARRCAVQSLLDSSATVNNGSFSHHDLGQASARDVIDKFGGKEAFMKMMHAAYHPASGQASPVH